MKKAAVIILNYNNYEDTIQCIKSVQKNTYPYFDIIVVDNCSSNDSVKQIKAIFDDEIIFMETGVNLGYAGGNNVGLRYAMKQEYEYLCILNNDTIAAPDFLTQCVDYLNHNEDVAFVGPMVLDYQSDTIQSTGSNLIPNKGWMELINNGKKKNEVEKIIECDYISGACLVFKSEFLKQHGLIPENYFLFFEETEWCYRAKQKGYRNVCITTTSIEHKGSVSIKQVDGLSAYLGSRNRVIFFKRNISDGLAYIGFIFYLFITTAVSAVKERNMNNLKLYKPYMDGILNRVSKEYPFIIINDNKGI